MMFVSLEPEHKDIPQQSRTWSISSKSNQWYYIACLECLGVAEILSDLADETLAVTLF